MFREFIFTAVVTLISMPVELLTVLIAVALGVIATTAWFWRRVRLAPPAAAVAPPREGILVSDELLQTVGSDSTKVREALTVAATPIALEFFPADTVELTKYRTVPLNESLQRSVVELIKAVSPKNPTVFRAILPKGKELVRAVGTVGYRGFSRTGGETAMAVLKPVGVVGTAAISWPLFAVGATVMAVDAIAQREQRAHRAKLESILDRQQRQHFEARISTQKTADRQLSRAIRLMLDGGDASLEIAYDNASREFETAKQFLNAHRELINHLMDGDGRVDYRRLDAALKAASGTVPMFFGELRLVQSALALWRKALIADAALAALADPTNPYSALRQHFEGEVRDLEQAEALAAQLIDGLRLELKGRLRDSLVGRLQPSDKSVESRQAWIREQVAPADIEDEPEVLLIRDGAGEVLRLVPTDEIDQPESGEDSSEY